MENRVKNLKLTFEYGSILTKEMLRELQDFPQDMGEILYASYPDGIVAGMEVVEQADGVYLKRGIVKYGGCLYRSEADSNLTELAACLLEEGSLDSQNIYKVVLAACKEEAIDGRTSQVLRSLQCRIVSLDTSVEGIELASFRPFGEFHVRLYQEKDLEDISGAFFFNAINCPYACRSGLTYHPYIFECIKRKLIKKKRKSSTDYVVLNEIASKGILNIEFIRILLNERLPEKCPSDGWETVGRKESLKLLLKALEQEEVAVIEATPEEAPKALPPERDGRML